jgi:hypothetical protein
MLCLRKESINQYLRQGCSVRNMQHAFLNHGVTDFSLVSSMLIETSLVSAHFADHPLVIYLDVFGCAPWDPNEVPHRRPFFQGAPYQQNSPRSRGRQGRAMNWKNTPTASEDHTRRCSCRKGNNLCWIRLETIENNCRKPSPLGSSIKGP